MPGEVGTTYRAVEEALEDAFLRQLTGRLLCRSAARDHCFYLLGGQLYLAGDNPWKVRLERVLVEPAVAGDAPFFDPQAYLESSLGTIVDGFCRDLVAMSSPDVWFTDVLGETPDDLVGPLPTARVVMDLGTRDRSQQELLHRLGGPDAELRAAEDPRMRLRVPYLSADDLALLERLREPTPVRVLLAEVADGRELTSQLVRLLCVGLLERTIVTEPESRSLDLVADRLSDKVRAALAERPVDMPASGHRKEVTRRLSGSTAASALELLELPPGPSEEEVYAAFLRIARLCHPDHASALGLERSRAEMDRLWIRLVEAYLLLSDPMRAAEQGVDPTAPAAGSATGNSPGRRSERETVAREAYLAALDFVEAEEYHYAIELLLQATLHADRPEYHSLLGHCQMQNPRWMRLAVDSFRRAVRLNPHDEELRRQLTEATEIYHARGAEAAEERPDPASEGAESAIHRRLRQATEKLRSSWS